MLLWFPLSPVMPLERDSHYMVQCSPDTFPLAWLPPHVPSAPVYDTYQVPLQHPSCPPSLPHSHASSLPPRYVQPHFNTGHITSALDGQGLSCIDDTAPIYLSDTTHVESRLGPLHAYAGTSNSYGAGLL